jgi:hypothetical protein
MKRLIILMMCLETSFFDAQAKYRSTLDAVSHRLIEKTYQSRQYD